MDIDMNIDIDVCVCASDLFPLRLVGLCHYAFISGYCVKIIPTP